MRTSADTISGATRRGIDAQAASATAASAVHASRSQPASPAWRRPKRTKGAR